MVKVFALVVVILMAISPFLFVWSATHTGSGFEYHIKISPIFYEVKEKNKYGYVNISEINPISEITPSKLYTNHSIRNPKQLMLMGITYLIITFLMIIVFISGIMRSSIKMMDIAISFYLFVFLAYIVSLFYFLKSANLVLVGYSNGFYCLLQIGFYVPIISGGIYEIGRIFGYF